MNRFGALVIALATLAPAAKAQIFQASIRMTLPEVLPPMVVVEPGVQVVQDLDDEVFFVDGWYWTRRGPHWYRARDYRRTWVYAEPRFVPHGLSRIPPGQYRRYRHAAWKEEHREEKARRRAFHEEQKERRREEKHAEKEWKRERKEHEREEHHGRD